MAFDLQPTLSGHLVGLRPLRAGDWEPLYAVASDPLIWAQHPQPDRYKEEVFRGFFRDALASGGALVAVDATTQRIIGSSRFCRLHEAAGEVEIGYTFLARTHWGGRTNAEMKRLMLDHAFAFVSRVTFRIGSTNLRSRTAIERIGAVCVDSVSDGTRTSLVYEIRRPPSC
jgi:RimJ/RimL family protein N-acetyltransferase